MVDEKLQALIDQHVEDVKASSEAWTAMCEAQAVSRAARAKEHESSKAIDEYVTSLFIHRFPSNMNENFGPVRKDLDW